MLPDFPSLSPYRNDRNSLEANHLILVWIMKVKTPKNQADFIEVLYVVVNALGATFLKQGAGGPLAEPQG